jgi:sugar/nucleoside kinase (ribokinase family)
MHLHAPIADWLEKNPSILLAFQPGTFQIRAGLETLARIYARADVFLANKEEYQKILNTPEEDEKNLMAMMRTHGPKICFLTDGVWKIGVYQGGEDAYERTGAGDAFSATAVAALLLGKSVPEALTWGPINSAFVVQKIGAQEGLLTRTVLEECLAKAPADYGAVAF